MKSINNFQVLLLSLVMFTAVLLVSCGGGIKPTDKDTPTTGHVRIGVDNSYALLVDAERNTFLHFYPYASIDTMSGSEADIINAFMVDSIPLMVVSRKLTPEEEARLKTQQIYPKTTMIAHDAVAFIVNKENPDTALFYDKIESIFRGNVKSWKDINPKSPLNELKVVFDSYKSANTRYFREKFNLEKLPATCFALENSQQVIDHVEKNKGAIGVISVNWVSDKEDTVSHTFLGKIKVVAISRPGNNDPGTDFYTPHPGYVVEGYYPFTRDVYVINRQTYYGMGYGFSSFLAGEKGQLIILRAGMVPASMPLRLV
ncbi:MAG: PstS family phosphate ABC transporter substrate-binding protein, partial [Syntrophothermus sp.]